MELKGDDKTEDLWYEAVESSVTSTAPNVNVSVRCTRIWLMHGQRSESLCYYCNSLEPAAKASLIALIGDVGKTGVWQQVTSMRTKPRWLRRCQNPSGLSITHGARKAELAPAQQHPITLSK